MAKIIKKSKAVERQKQEQEQKQRELDVLLKEFLLTLAIGDKKLQKELSDSIKDYVKGYVKSSTSENN